MQLNITTIKKQQNVQKLENIANKKIIIIQKKDN